MTVTTLRQNPAITRRLFNISFPRSGHHFVRHTLDAYFGDSFVHCGYHYHCNHWPCSRPSTTLQTDHDQWLNVPILAGEQYLFLFRHPLPALQSYFDLFLEMGWLPPELDTVETWQHWFEGGLGYWQRLVERWAIDGPDGRCVLSYEDLMDDPVMQIAELVELMAPGEAADRERLAAILERDGSVRYMPGMDRDRPQTFKARALERFRYYRPADLARANACVEALPKSVVDISAMVRAPLVGQPSSPTNAEPILPRYAAADPQIAFVVFPGWEPVHDFVATVQRIRPALYAEMMNRALLNFHILPILLLPVAALDGATRDYIELGGGRIVVDLGDAARQAAHG